MEKDIKKVDIASMSRAELEEFAMKKSLETEELSAKLSWYEEQIRLSRSKMYGKSSEQTSPEQLSIFNEAEETSEPITVEPTIDKVVSKNPQPSKKGQKKKMLSSLPSETIEYELSAEEQICPECGSQMHDMTTKTRSEITVIPAQAKVRNHEVHSYSCRNCEKNGINVPIIKADSPNSLIKGSACSSSLISYIINNKYVLALPLYRQAQELNRLGIKLNRQNLSNWVIKVAKVYLSLVYRLMHEELKRKNIVHCDETTVEVLREPGRDAEQTSYMWLYCTGKDEQNPIVLYEYKPGRSGEYPKAFLNGFEGYILTDGYSGYNKLIDADADPPLITRVGCWAHARRKYDEVLRSLSDKQIESAKLTSKGLAYCNRLFGLETEWQDLTPDERHEKRSEIAAPIVDEYFAWVKGLAETIAVPKSGLGSAVTYSLKQEDNLRHYLLDGRLEISNNRAERFIKPFVIGRKNWMFSNTPAGADSSAVIYSVVQTALANGLNARAYIEYILDQMPNMDISDDNNLWSLMPWSASLPESIKKTATSDGQ